MTKQKTENLKNKNLWWDLKSMPVVSAYNEMIYFTNIYTPRNN